MLNLSLRYKVLSLSIILAIALFTIYQTGWLGKASAPTASPSSTNVSQNDTPRIISTKPDPLEDNLISGTEAVEITFNRPLENVGEFKSRIEPKIDYKVELSGDRKTARIIPAKPYPLGTTFTLFIGTETKFDGLGRWGQEKIFHFRTIKYTGV